MSAVSAGSATPPEPLRQRLFSFLHQEIGAIGNHTLMSAKDLAERFTVTPVTISKHLHALEQDGYIRTKAAGPRGTIIALEALPRPGTDLAPRSRRRSAGGAAPVAIRRAGRAYFCPWCGSKIQKVWRFCNRCGERLPH